MIVLTGRIASSQFWPVQAPDLAFRRLGSRSPTVPWGSNSKGQMPQFAFNMEAKLVMNGKWPFSMTGLRPNANLLWKFVMQVMFRLILYVPCISVCGHSCEQDLGQQATQ